MSQYSKLIGALIGVAVIIVYNKYGIDLKGTESELTTLFIQIADVLQYAVGPALVYQLRND